MRSCGRSADGGAKAPAGLGHREPANSGLPDEIHGGVDQRFAQVTVVVAVAALTLARPWHGAFSVR
jgi:hypothetical protein